ncbi:hypothetical protein P2318_32650 [Myxococcaceae bacterium GXIMD 01537]
MAVRTKIAGIKERREVGVKAAHSTQGTTHGKKTLPRDEAAMLRREKALARVTLGPAAKEPTPKSHRGRTTVQGRKKAPSEMKVKRSGGPKRRLPLHGG